MRTMFRRTVNLFKCKERMAVREIIQRKCSDINGPANMKVTYPRKLNSCVPTVGPQHSFSQTKPFFIIKRSIISNGLIDSKPLSVQNSSDAQTVLGRFGPFVSQSSVRGFLGFFRKSKRGDSESDKSTQNPGDKTDKPENAKSKACLMSMKMPVKRRSACSVKKEKKASPCSSQKAVSPCPKKKESQCPKKTESARAKKKEPPPKSPCPKKKESSCAQKKASPCSQKKESPCPQKKESPCAQKKESPCAQKKASPCPQKKENPCVQKKESPCAQKKESPCPQKKESPCAQKKASPCAQKKESPCSKPAQPQNVCPKPPSSSSSKSNPCSKQSGSTCQKKPESPCNKKPPCPRPKSASPCDSKEKKPCQVPKTTSTPNVCSKKSTPPPSPCKKPASKSPCDKPCVVKMPCPKQDSKDKEAIKVTSKGTCDPCTAKGYKIGSEILNAEDEKEATHSQPIKGLSSKPKPCNVEIDPWERELKNRFRCPSKPQISCQKKSDFQVWPKNVGCLYNVPQGPPRCPLQPTLCERELELKKKKSDTSPCQSKPKDSKNDQSCPNIGPSKCSSKTGSTPKSPLCPAKGPSCPPKAPKTCPPKQERPRPSCPPPKTC